MTAIIGWSTSDGHGVASLYLGADSRISAQEAGGRTRVVDDEFQKTFSSPATPDIFAVSGPITKLDSLIGLLFTEAGRIRAEISFSAEAIGEFTRELIARISQRCNATDYTGLCLLHGYRFRDRDFGLTRVAFGEKLILEELPLRSTGGLLVVDGAGRPMVEMVQGEYISKESEAKEFSRWFWMSFVKSLDPATNKTCGGAPQLVGLYTKGPGVPLGVFFRNRGYVFGKPIDRTDLEYRDELFQRVNNYGLLLGGAQRHARKLGSPRHFDFA